MKRVCASLTVGLFCLLALGCHSKPQSDAKPNSAGVSKGADNSSGGSDSTNGQKRDSAPADVVKISREDQSRAGIQVSAVTVRAMPQVLSTAAQVAMDEKHTQHIGTLADGRIESVFVLPGDPVRRGQTLATLHSHVVHETVAALTQAFAAVNRQQSAVTYATQARDRYAKLYSIQAASLEEKQRSEQELAQAQKDLIDAQANVHAEREHLAELLQVSPDSLRPGTLLNRELIPVRAVADGTVITRSITPGQVVSTGDEAFVTSDLSTVWVNAAVNEKDVPLIHIGQAAVVTVLSNQGTPVKSTATQADDSARSLRGRVSMIGDLVDPQTRTLPVRVLVPNPGTVLRPGMFTTAAIEEAATRVAIFVPSEALQDVNGIRIVFVTADGNTFQARAVKTGALSGNLVEVTDGLQPSDHVVVSGAFMVKGELLKGTVGEG